MLEVPRPPEPWLPVVRRWRTDQGSEETGAGDAGCVIDTHQMVACIIGRVIVTFQKQFIVLTLKVVD